MSGAQFGPSFLALYGTLRLELLMFVAWKKEDIHSFNFLRDFSNI